MPYSAKTVKAARAAAHGWKPTGKAKGMSMAFAEEAVEAGVKGKGKAKGKTHKKAAKKR